MATKCSKGKSCGASCVQRSKHCAVELGAQASAALGKVRQKIGVVGLFEAVKQHKAPGFRAKFERIRGELKAEIGGQIRKPEHVAELKKRLQKEGLLPVSKKVASALPKSLKEKPSSSRKEDPETDENEWYSLTPGEYDDKLRTKNLRRVGDPKFDEWAADTSYRAGEGSFGKVNASPDGTFVKRGILTDNEAVIMQKVAGADMGPRLLAADLNGKVKVEEQGEPNLELYPISHLGLRHGRLAMTRVPGRDLEEALAETGQIEGPETKINGKPAADIYWTAMANLHRLGVAHNDAHPGNLFIDENGRGRWIDYGMAQDSPRAALAEGLGAFAHSSVFHGRDYRRYLADDAQSVIYDSPGNWQTREWNVTGMDRVDAVSGKPAAKRLEADLPVVARIRSNRKEVDRLLEEKYGLNQGEIAAIYAHGIRSPLNSYEQGPWRKLSEKDAQDLINVLYKGV